MEFALASFLHSQSPNLGECHPPPASLSSLQRHFLLEELSSLRVQNWGTPLPHGRPAQGSQKEMSSCGNGMRVRETTEKNLNR